MQRERIFLQPLRDRADYILDTTDVKAQDFPKLIAKVLPEFERHRMTLLFSMLEYLGVEIDEDRNSRIFGEEAVISTPQSRVTVAVVPTDEELMMAEDTMRIVGQG